MTKNCILIVFILLLSGCLLAQQHFDARSTGMAFSNAAAARGIGTVGGNPAALGLKTSYAYEVNLFSGVASFSNNGLSKAQYDDYFTTGDLLTQEAIDDILNSVPDDGMRANVGLRVNTLAVYAGNFSFSIYGQGSGFVKIARDVFDLPLNGNGGTGRVYNIDDTDGSGWAGFGARASAAFPLPVTGEGLFSEAAVGFTLNAFSGQIYGDLSETRGELEDYSLQANRPFIRIDAEWISREAEGGRGIGVDLGGIAVLQEKLTVGVSLTNLFSQVEWTDGTRRRVFSIKADSLNLPNRVGDSLLTDIDSTFALDSFNTHLPRMMDIAVALQATPDVLIALEYEQGFDSNMGGIAKPRLALGFELTPLDVLPIRGGFSIGGKTGTSFAFGTGLNLKYWQLDVAFLNAGGSIVVPSPDSKGITLAVSTKLRF